MALEIEINAEVTKYKAKMLLGLDSRKIVAGVIILGTGIPYCVLAWDKLDRGVLILGFLAIIIIPGFIGFCPNWNGIPPERMFAKMWHINIDPQKRKYQELPVFWYAREEIIAEELEQQRADERLLRKAKGRKRVKKGSDWTDDGAFHVRELFDDVNDGKETAA